MLWSILGWTLAALLLAVVLPLALPVDVTLTADSRAAPPLSGRVGLLGGLVPPIPFATGARTSARPKRKMRKARQRGGSGRTARHLPGLIVSLVRQIRLRRLSVHARIATPDPAATGQLFGLLTACAAPLSGFPQAEVTLIPDFASDRISGRAELALRATPLAFVPPLLRFAWAAWGPGR